MVDLEHDPGRPTPRAPSANPLGRVLDWVAWLCTVVAGVALVVLIAIFGWLVYGRYVLNDTPTWVEQLSILLIAYITFLGAAAGVRQNTHLAIEFIRDSMPRRADIALRFLADAMMIAFGAFMAWQGWHLVATNMRRAIPMIGLSESWRAFPLVVCGGLIVAFVGYAVVVRIVRLRREEI